MSGITKQELDPKLAEEIGIGDTTSSPIEVAINRGLQSITVPLGTPVNVLNFTGRTVINYVPLFDSALWTLHSKANLTSPNKITLIADAVNQISTIKLSVRANTNFTLSVKHNATIEVHSGDDTVNITGRMNAEVVTFNSGSNTSILLYLHNYDKIGTFTFENVMLNEGPTAKEFVANVKGLTNPTIKNNTTGDSITAVGTFHSGDIVDVVIRKVTRTKREMILDGNLSWVAFGKGSDYTLVRIVMSDSKYMEVDTVKYDGKILPVRESVDIPDVSAIDYNLGFYYVTIGNSDSGWGPNYTPTVEEIKGYFEGWKMFDTATSSDGSGVYNGTGNKAFVYREYTGVYQYVGTELPKYRAPINAKWRPYRVVYDLVTPVIESLKTIGSLRLASGDNTVDLTEGRIVRERVSPRIYTGNGKFHIGTTKTFDTGLDNPLKFLQSNIIRVYKNGIVDTLWSLAKDIGPSYTEYAYIDGINFDPTAIYEVEYLPQELYKVSAHSNPMTVSYSDTLGGVTSELVKDITTMDGRISSNESAMREFIVGNTAYAKKAQEPWKTLVLENLWGVTQPVMYRKDEFGVVRVIGRIQSGDKAISTVPFRFPYGYRPATEIIVPFSGYNDSSDVRPLLLGVSPAGHAYFIFAIDKSYLVFDFSFPTT